MASRMKTWPHSEHSFKAVRSLLIVCGFMSNMCALGELSLISLKAATALATTIGLESEMRSRSKSRKPCSSTSCEFISNNLATHTAAVFLTYGSSSFKHLRNGSQRYSVILSTRMQPMVRTAKALIKGFGSSQSFIKKFFSNFYKFFSIQYFLFELIYLNECINGHDGHVRLRFGVIHQVEVNQLFEF